MTTQTLDVIPSSTANTLDGLFYERIKRTPDSVAYNSYNESEQVWKESSWREMGLQVARWQKAMEGESLITGDRVAIMLRNCTDWVLFDQAALGLGLVVVPLYCNDRPGNIAYILKDAGVKLLLVQNREEWQEMGSECHQLDSISRILTIDLFEENQEDSRLISTDDWLPEQGGELTKRDGVSDDLATIVYTSGTTGKPKGVKLSHKNILWNAESGIKSISVYREDLFLSFLPLSHTLERSIGYYLAMMAGASVAYARSIPLLSEDLTTIRPTVIISVPRIFERVYSKIKAQLEEKPAFARKLFDLTQKIGGERFEYQQKRGNWALSFMLWSLLDLLVAGKIKEKLGGRIRFAISGGAALSSKVGKLFLNLGVPLVQGYGLTETSPVISVNQLDDNTPSSVGILLDGVEARIGEGDELQVKSPGVMLGYWNNSEATKQLIDEQGWLHTGDKARLEGSRVYITGRLKEIIVLANGEKVPPADIEMAIALDPLFEQVLIIGEGRGYLSAIVVLNVELLTELEKEIGSDAGTSETGNGSLEDILIERIGNQMGEFPGYAQIRKVFVISTPWTIENGMQTPTLKLRRNSILKQYSELVESMYEGH